MLRTNTMFCCHRNEIIARLKEDFGYETRLPLTGPILSWFSVLEWCSISCIEPLHASEKHLNSGYMKLLRPSVAGPTLPGLSVSRPSDPRQADYGPSLPGPTHRQFLDH